LPEIEFSGMVKMESIIAALGDAVSIQDTNFKVLYQNQIHKDFVGDHKGEYCYMAYEHRDQICEGCPVAMSLSDGKIHTTERSAPLANGISYFEITASPFHDSTGKIIAVIEIGRDITERKRSEDLIKKSKEFSEAVINSMKDAISVIDVNDHRIIDANSVFLDNYGMKKEEVVGKKCYEVTHKRNEQCITPDDCPISNTLNTGKHSTIEHVHYNESGEKRYVEVSVSPIVGENGKITSVIHVAHDITERKSAEEQIKSSLREKETLLREIHHRVKNNMQIISSLLDHQCQFIKNKNVIDIFRESQNRIVSMSLIHEKLYQSKDLAKIDFNEYINDLVSNLFESYEVNPGKINLNMNIENIQLNIEFAIPCGLITNELVTNSLKYAFSSNIRGEIKIAFSKTEENMFELVICDNGIGLPKDLDFRKTESLGLHLVTILAENQLHGEIDLYRNEGTGFKIKFREVT